MKWRSVLAYNQLIIRCSNKQKEKLGCLLRPYQSELLNL